MSNIQRFENLKQLVVQAQVQFEALAKVHGAINYQREASFAMQAISENEYLASIAIGNQDSFKRAIINVAAIGLTLSPVYKLAYLVPRDKKVVLDISYKGLIQLAINISAIKWAHADIVCKNDQFRLRGLGIEPLHEFDPFGDRGEVVGAYCTVKTLDSEFLTTVMTTKEIEAIRNRSQSWIAGKSSPWKSDPNEMFKKTVIRRAYKMWPLPAEQNRLEEAINVINENDPVDFDKIEDVTPSPDLTKTFEFLRQGLVTLGRSEDQYVKHLTSVNKREIKKIEDMTEIETNNAKILMDQWLESKKAKDDEQSKKQEPVAEKKTVEQNEVTNENIESNK